MGLLNHRTHNPPDVLSVEFPWPAWPAFIPRGRARADQTTTLKDVMAGAPPLRWNFLFWLNFDYSRRYYSVRIDVCECVCVWGVKDCCLCVINENTGGYEFSNHPSEDTAVAQWEKHAICQFHRTCHRSISPAQYQPPQPFSFLIYPAATSWICRTSGAFPLIIVQWSYDAMQITSMFLPCSSHAQFPTTICSFKLFCKWVDSCENQKAEEQINAYTSLLLCAGKW